MELRLNLPWPPSVNSYKKIGRLTKTKTGKLYQQRVNTNETKTFYFQVWIKCKQLLPTPYTKEDRLSVEVVLYPPSNRFDIDNPIKVLLDSLTRAHVWPDDRQIYKLLIIKKPADPDDARVIVTITKE